jgi:hypothetical protein
MLTTFPPAPSSPPTAPPALQPHRGTVVLVLGILGVVWPLCGSILGIIAWVMGNHDLRDMNAGRMDPSGRSITDAGRMLGIVSVCMIIALVFLFIVFVLVLMFLVGAGTAAYWGY